MLDRIIVLLEREIASIEHSILKGACPDYTSYREQVGALAAFIQAMEVTRKAFSDDDEEDDHANGHLK